MASNIGIAIIHSTQCMKYILAMKTDIIIARAGNKLKEVAICLIVYIAFFDYITHSSCMPCLMLTQQVKVLPSSV